jgi:hypothetical protein
VLHQTADKAGLDDMRFSALEIADYRQRNHTLSGLVEYHSMSFTDCGVAAATGYDAGGFGRPRREWPAQWHSPVC